MDSSQLRSSFIELINQARSHPGPTSEKIYETFAPLYHEDQLRAFNKNIDTFEGIGALQDLKRSLQNIRGVDGLIPSDALCRVAQSIAQEKGTIGRTDHQNPQFIYQRISSFASVSGRIGELIALRANSGEEVATYFMLDDGLATRKRRRMLLDPKFRYIGVGSAPHRQHEVITVILLSQEMGQLRISQVESELQSQSFQQRPEMKDMAQSSANSYFNKRQNSRESDYRQI